MPHGRGTQVVQTTLMRAPFCGRSHGSRVQSQRYLYVLPCGAMDDNALALEVLMHTYYVIGRCYNEMHGKIIHPRRAVVLYPVRWGRSVAWGTAAEPEPHWRMRPRADWNYCCRRKIFLVSWAGGTPYVARSPSSPSRGEETERVCV